MEDSGNNRLNKCRLVGRAYRTPQLWVLLNIRSGTTPGIQSVTLKVCYLVLADTFVS